MGRARSQAGEAQLGQGYLRGEGGAGTGWRGVEPLSQEVKGSFDFGQEGGQGSRVNGRD